MGPQTLGFHIGSKHGAGVRGAVTLRSARSGVFKNILEHEDRSTAKVRQGARTQQPLSSRSGCLGGACGCARVHACACVWAHVHVVGRGSCRGAGVCSHPMKGRGYLVGSGRGQCPAEPPPPAVTPEGVSGSGLTDWGGGGRGCQAFLKLGRKGTLLPETEPPPASCVPRALCQRWRDPLW